MPAAHRSLKGQLLLDGGKLSGSFFHRTVVLVCQHDSDGAFGLVLNRPADGRLGDLIESDLPQTLEDQPVYLGGPVQPSALTYLHTDAQLLEANVLPQLSMGHSLESLVEIASSGSPTGAVRVFAGYSGWSPGQLDQEMKRGAWLTHPATAELVLRSDPALLWQLILKLKGGVYPLLADAPEDLGWN